MYVHQNGKPRKGLAKRVGVDVKRFETLPEGIDRGWTDRAILRIAGRCQKEKRQTIRQVLKEKYGTELRKSLQKE